MTRKFVVNCDFCGQEITPLIQLYRSYTEEEKKEYQKIYGNNGGGLYGVYQIKDLGDICGGCLETASPRFKELWDKSLKKP